MVNFKKLFFLSFLFLFIFSADFSLDQISNGMSKEEIAALEEIMKMSPEELAAMEKEIQNVLNDLPPEERDKILEEAARFEEQLISNIKDNSFLNQDLTNKKEIPKSSEQPIKNAEPNLKPVNLTVQKELDNLLERILDGFDHLILMVHSSPLLHHNLKLNSQWLKFTEHYHQLYSLINSIFNNKNLQNNLLQTEWETLRNELLVIDKTLQLIAKIEYEDGIDGISRKEVQEIEAILEGDLFRKNTENISWSLKRFIQKYSEETLKKATEQAEAIKKTGEYRFPTSNRSMTSTPKEQKNKSGLANNPNKGFSSPNPISRMPQPAANSNKAVSPSLDKEKPKSGKKDTKDTNKDTNKDKKDTKDTTKDTKSGKKETTDRNKKDTKETKDKDIRISQLEKKIDKIVENALDIIKKLESKKDDSEQDDSEKVEIADLNPLRDDLFELQKRLAELIISTDFKGLAKDILKSLGKINTEKLLERFYKYKIDKILDIKSIDFVNDFNTRKKTANLSADIDKHLGLDKVTLLNKLESDLVTPDLDSQKTVIKDTRDTILTDIVDRLLTLALFMNDNDKDNIKNYKETKQNLINIRTGRINIPEPEHISR